jgi:2-methylcitrate dehydratase
MTSTDEIAEFAAGVRYDRLPTDVRSETKRRILDAIGVGLKSHTAGRADAVGRALESENSRAASRLWGSTREAAPAWAALYNTVLAESGNSAVFLSPTLAAAYAPVAAVLAAAEATGTTGEETLAGLAVAHEIHGELAWNAPLDEFDRATHTAVAAAAGVGRATGLDATELRNAIGTTASRVTLSVGEEEFAPLSAGIATQNAVQACRLAESGVEAPDAIGGSDGWHGLVGPFDLDLDPGCERVGDAAVLPYDAHPHAQSAIEAAINLASETAIDPADIDSVTVETARNAVSEIDSERIAAALVDRELSIHRGGRADLDPIVEVTDIEVADETFEHTALGGVPARVTVGTHGEGVYEATVRRFSGHPAAPASWGLIEEKFNALAGEIYDRDRCEEIIETVRRFEAESPAELARLLD